MKLKKNRGFTILELLVVMAIIGVLTAIVLLAINDARNKGSDGGVKSNLAGARAQAEVFYNSNTANPETYLGVCNNGIVGGEATIGFMVDAAAEAVGLSTYGINTTGSLATATCNTNATSWAAEVPLRSGGMWCVDSTGISINTVSSIGSGTSCP